MAIAGLHVQELKQAAWQDVGSADAGELGEVVERVARHPGIYRGRKAGDDMWHFFYVDENGRVVNSNAASRL